MNETKKRYRCKNCKKIFSCYPCHNRKYCSASCYHEATKKKNRSKICCQCGDEFIPRTRGESTARYCSLKCAGAAKKAKRTRLICDHCGKEFSLAPSDAAKRKHCSQACYTNAQKEKGWKICERCGKEFKPTGGIIQKFCSRSCAHPRKKKINLTCQTCGQQYIPKHGRDKTSKFCSRECHTRVQKKDGSRQYFCEICGKKFQRHAYRKARFCGWECAAIGRRGAKSPCWKGGSYRWYGDNWGGQRLKALKRDHRRCQMCGKKGFLHVHHLMPFRLFRGDWKKANVLKNLISLCPKCHGEVEKSASHTVIVKGA